MVQLVKLCEVVHVAYACLEGTVVQYIWPLPPGVAVKPFSRQGQIRFWNNQDCIVIRKLTRIDSREMANMSFDAYIQRADDYITKQIHKYEQQKRGRGSPPRANGYRQMPLQPPQHGRQPSQGGYPGSPAPQDGQYPQPPANPMLPHGWSQEFDPSSQRWYYVDRTTGRSQWNPPPHAPPRAATFQSDATMLSPHQSYTREDENRTTRHTRSNSQPQRPMSNPDGHGQHLNPRQHVAGRAGSLSPSMQLPPGSHLDLSTGRVVNSMFPEGQNQQSWSQSLQRI